MKATEILMSEHRVIERLICALEGAAGRLEQGQDVDPGFFLQAAEFNRNYTDGCHHRKEEGILFKVVAANGVPEQGNIIRSLLFEHEQGRAFTQRMRAAAEKVSAGDLQARQEIISNACGYAGLLRRHIIKEDRIFFPLVDRSLPADEQKKMAADFAQAEAETEAGVHEKYLALAGALEKELEG